MIKSFVCHATAWSAFALSFSALAQLGPPVPGSAQGTESGTYGSSSGFDVRGTGPVDRFGRPNDPMNPTDTGRKPVDPRDARQQRETGKDNTGTPANARGPADARTSNLPGANMNPGMSPGAVGSTQPSVSPNLNPGMSPALGGAGGPAPAGNASGTTGGSAR